jgi:hypothetical protein
LKPSGRGKLEITDVNNVYIKELSPRTFSTVGGPTLALSSPFCARTPSLLARRPQNAGRRICRQSEGSAMTPYPFMIQWTMSLMDCRLRHMKKMTQPTP